MRAHNESGADCWCEPRIIVVYGESHIFHTFVHHPEEWSQFTRFRADGWPLCPGCGEDELWTPWTPPADAEATFDDYVANKFDDYVANKLRCLACRWESQ